VCQGVGLVACGEGRARPGLAAAGAPLARLGLVGSASVTRLMSCR
jgi:hypothetical protein